MVAKGETVYVLIPFGDGRLREGDRGIVEAVSVIPSLPLVLVNFNGVLIDCWEHHLTTIKPESQDR